MKQSVIINEIEYICIPFHNASLNRKGVDVYLNDRFLFEIFGLELPDPSNQKQRNKFIEDVTNWVSVYNNNLENF